MRFNPDRSDVDESVTLTRRFLTETSERISGRLFGLMSLLDEIDNSGVKTLLEQAEASFGQATTPRHWPTAGRAFYLVF